MAQYSKQLTRVLALVGVLFIFFVSLQLMGDAFKLMGRGFAEQLLSSTPNPLMAVFIGILATSIVQSSSTTTSLVVTLVAGGLPLETGIPIIMGANVGTTVTNTIVSMGHITRPEEFKRAMAGATVHDFFNFFAVAIILPLEIFFKVLTKSATWLTQGFATVGGAEFLNPLKAITKPVTKMLIGLVQENGILVLILGLVLLFFALRYMVVLLKSIFLGKTEGFMDKYIFGTPLVAMGVGVLLTILVQSSSVTTSLVVPMVGAGILTVRQIFPFTLGANVGTTITAILAALVASSDAGNTVAITAAFAHLLFNIFGIVIVYGLKPLRELVLKFAEGLGTLAVTNRVYAIAYLVGVFFLLPILLELIGSLFY